jgi:hypothetical protein
MAGYGYDDYDAPTRERTTRYVREERRGGGERERRYERDDYLGVHPSRDLVPRGRENSDLSVEEIHRDFPPPGYARDIRRARSAGPYDDYDDRSSIYRDDRDYDRRSKKGGSSIRIESEERKRARVLGKQEQIIAAITGAALAIGGKELYDRREAKQEGRTPQRNVLATAALGAAGGFAAYQGTELYNKHAEKEKEKKSTMVVHKGRDGKVDAYYSEEEVEPKEKKGHKNFLEGALAAAGLGGAVKALTGGHDDKRSSDSRSRAGSRSRSPKGKGEGANKIQKAAMASLIAGATEAFRVSKEPGGWKGEKAKRVLTAAAGAATIDAAQNPEKSGKLGLAESVIGGLVGNRLVNGSKKNIEEDKKTGRSRSRSRARSDGGGGGTGLAALATAGLGAFGAKKIYDSHKDKERERSRSRRRSVDSYDSRGSSPDRRRQRSRSRSVVDTARRSLARIGIGNGPEDDRDEDRPRDRRRGGYSDDDEPPKSRRHRKYDSDDDSDYSRGHGRGGGKPRDYDDDRSTRGGGGRERSRSRGAARRRGTSRGSGSDSDLGDSDEDAKRAKKMRGKQIITTGLAAVATIHAAHNVYQSMEKRRARHKAVKEGRLSPEEAKKLKSKALLQDAASVGIAALGIKGAISELKEANEMRHEMREWKEEREERHRKRLERQKRLMNGHADDRDDSNYDRRRADSWSPTAPRRGGGYDGGPRYTDGNPYSAALPAPPVGYSDRR